MVNQINRVVVKVGSSSIINENSQSIIKNRMLSIAEDICWLTQDHNKQVILMSSGALAWGRVQMTAAGISKECQKNQQIAGACGQIGVSASWEDSLRKYNLVTGQLLLAPRDLSSDFVCNSILSMLKNNVVPYINENIPTFEQYDNDGLAAEVALKTNSDTLILLSDVAGVYSSNPKTDAAAQLIKEISNIDEALTRYGHETSTNLGTGGMATKLHAAKKVSKLGVNTIIASGECSNPLKEIFNGSSGTFIRPYA